MGIKNQRAKKVSKSIKKVLTSYRHGVIIHFADPLEDKNSKEYTEGIAHSTLITEQ